MAHISEAGVKQVQAICDRYANEKTPLMMILSDIQNEYGYIPLEVQQIVSKKTGISVAEIYGVVTFYSFFSLKPKGKYVIGCCMGTACYVKGAQQIIDKFSEILGIGPGETTEDGMFTIDALRCIGACGLAPVLTVNEEVYGRLTVDDVDDRGVVVYHLHVAEEDMGRVIGKQGRIAKAIRTVVKAGATRTGEKVQVDID